MESGAGAVHMAQENPVVNNFTETSKSVIGTVGSTVSGVTSVI